MKAKIEHIKELDFGFLISANIEGVHLEFHSATLTEKEIQMHLPLQYKMYLNNLENKKNLERNMSALMDKEFDV